MMSTSRPHWFQSTLPRGERHGQLWSIPICISVSIHAPAGGATPREIWHVRMPLCFNPRSRGGSDASNLDHNLTGLVFQSTLPRGERRNQIYAQVSFLEFQSTLPRGERHLSQHLSHSTMLVSIHAPAGGATRLQRKETIGEVVSIHAPAGGATPKTTSWPPQRTKFQSTLPRGERPIGSRCSPASRICFNPRSRGGSDHLCRR